MQSSFKIIDSNLFTEVPQELAVGLTLHIKAKENFKAKELLENYCIVAHDFERYIELVSKINSYDQSLNSQAERNNNSINDYLNIDFWEDPLMPFVDVVKCMKFVEMEALNDKDSSTKLLRIVKVYDPKALWQYWLPKNTISNPEAMQNIGLGKGIYNLVPCNHNYFDMCCICSCGHMECYNHIAWYIKNTKSFTVGFIINYYSTLEFNTQKEKSSENYLEAMERKNATLKHNAELDRIETFLSINSEGFNILNEEELLIYKEGRVHDYFPYPFEEAEACLYKPLINSNEQLKDWNFL